MNKTQSKLDFLLEKLSSFYLILILGMPIISTNRMDGHALYIPVKYLFVDLSQCRISEMSISVIIYGLIASVLFVLSFLKQSKVTTIIKQVLFVLNLAIYLTFTIIFIGCYEFLEYFMNFFILCALILYEYTLIKSFIFVYLRNADN